MPRPRRCSEHSRWTRGCSGCREYSRLVRKHRERLRAAGRWEGMVDASRARQRLRELSSAGMSTRQISEATGISRYTILCIRRGQSIVNKYVVDAILGCPTQPPRKVSGIGAARRLQALCCAGYSNEDIGKRIGRRALTVAHWRHCQPGQLITRQTHDLIATVYNDLWDTKGPSVVASRYAQRAGYLPFEAWTEETIDDPNASPYSEAASFVDEELLRRVRTHKRDFIELTPAEQLALFSAHMAAGGTPRGFRDKYRPVPIHILRWLQEAI